MLARGNSRLVVRELEGRVVPTAGALDPSFGNGGEATATSGLFASDTEHGQTLQADGKIVLAGLGDSHGPFLIRFTSTGILDTSFNGTGLKYFNPAASAGGSFVKVVEQPDGKLVAVGSVTATIDNQSRLIVVRFNSDGSIDNSFASGGLYEYSVPGSAAGAVALQADGKIVVAENQPSDFTMFRFNPNGTLDGSFNGGGIVQIAFGPDTINSVEDLIVQADGKIAVAGTGDIGGFAVQRFNSDGSLDNSFGTAGLVLTTPPTSWGWAINGLVQEADGKLVGVGSCRLPSQSGFNEPLPTVLRYNTNGSLDSSFGGGYVISPMTVSAFGSQFCGVAVQPSGKVIAAGWIFKVGGRVGIVARYNLDGTLDDTFGPAGQTFEPGVVQLAQNTQLTGVSLTPDGRIVVGGNSQGSFLAARLFGDADLFAQPDQYTFNENTQLTVNAPGVIGNDTILQGSPTAQLVSGPSHATQFTFNADGSFSYTPTAYFHGTDTFTYQLVNGADQSTPATVTLNVQNVNQPPLAVGDTYELPVDSPLNVTAISGVRANDTDVDGDTLHVNLVTPPTVGTLTLNDDGSFSYAFPADLHGSVTFTYQDFDGTVLGNTATVTLTREGFISVAGGILNIFATSGSDIIRILPAGTGLLVEMQTPLRTIQEIVHPQTGTPHFTGINADLGSGNDRFDTSKLHLPVSVVGGNGNDAIHTGSGKDIIVVEDGDNVILTGGGKDSVTAGNGRNDIETGAGNDTVNAGTGGSYFDAGSGNDIVAVAGGDNWIRGGTGNDILIGGSGNDSLQGGSGKDMLISGTGADELDGNGGNDILVHGTVMLAQSATDSLLVILAAYNPSNHAVLVDLSSRLLVTPDTSYAATLTGGAGTDWFWSVDALDLLDIHTGEPKNAVS